MHERAQPTTRPRGVEPDAVRGLKRVAGSSVDARPPRRVLVSRVGRIGDLVLITPALRGILDRYEGAEFHLLTSPDGVRALRGFDARLRELVVYRRKGIGHPLQRWRLRRALMAQEYDLVFCLDSKPTYHRFFSGIGRTRYVAQAGVRLLQTLDDLGGWQREGRPRWSTLPVQDEARHAARELLRRVGVPDDAILVGFHPTFSALRKLAWRRRSYEQRKRWPEESWAALARLVHRFGEELDRPLAIVADLLPEEREVGERIASLSGGALRVLAEEPNFERYKALLARMDALVTPDTGPMHIAAAVGTKLVALVPPKGVDQARPYTAPEQYTLIRPEPEAHLAAIEPERVFEALKAQLERAESDSRATPSGAEVEAATPSS